MPDSKPLPSPSQRPFAALQNSIDAFIINSVMSSTTTTTLGAKEPLSLQTTSSNFRRFVQKAGPIFLAQDAVESVFRWDDPSQTLFFGAIWAFLCLYPFLIIVLPNVILATVLLTTYSAKPTPLSFSSSSESPKAFTLSPAPPAEGSVDYLANLQNIQIMMGNIAKLTDLARSLLPYFTWQQPILTLVLLQLTLLSSILFFFISPYIPYRYLFLVIGESVLISTHPFTQTILRTGLPVLQSQSHKYFRKLRNLMEEDGIIEEELEGVIKKIEKWQVETRQLDNNWGSEVVVIGGELPKADEEESMEGVWRWVTALEWEVDLEGEWAGGKIDKDGWAYLNIDGTRSDGPSNNRVGQSRRRRLVRRAVKVVY